jgi:hypothetical protein
VVIGYPSNSKGYKLYDLITHSVFVSQNVVFHEHIFPFASHLKNFNSNGCFIVPKPISDVIPSTSVPSHNDSVDSHSASHDLSNSDPIVSAPPISIHVSVRQSTCVRRRPGYLQQFHCNLATQSTHPVGSTSSFPGTQHNISFVIGYNHLSHPYKHFSFSVSSHIEPKSFSQAVKSPQ